VKRGEICNHKSWRRIFSKKWWPKLVLNRKCICIRNRPNVRPVCSSSV
jgi:hypothetical protein